MKVLWIISGLWLVSDVFALPYKTTAFVLLDILMISSAIYLFRHFDDLTTSFRVWLPFDRYPTLTTPPQIIHIMRPESDEYRAGYVYLLKEINGTHYKIGCTHDPANRRKTFNVKLPYETAYLCLIASDDMHALEAELHAKFANKRVSGEWFCLSDADVQYIISLAYPVVQVPSSAYDKE